MLDKLEIEPYKSKEPDNQRRTSPKEMFRRKESDKHTYSPRPKHVGIQTTTQSITENVYCNFICD